MRVYEFSLSEYGKENDDKLIMRIEAGTEISGLNALIRRTIAGLYFATKMHAIPVVSWEKSRLLNAHKTINGSRNPFEYFFCPMSGISLKNAKKSRNVIDYDYTYDYLIWEEMRLPSTDSQTDAFIKLQRNVVSTYPFILKKRVRDSMNRDIVALIGKRRLLGVHMRGAQRKRSIEGLGNPISVDWYLREISRMLGTGKYEGIFLATDDEEYLQCLLEEYPQKVFFFTDTQRSTNGKIPYFQESSQKYRIGYEMLRDMYALMECRALLGGPSNVTMMTRVLNKRPERWEECLILDNGVCADGDADYETTLEIINNNGQM